MYTFPSVAFSLFINSITPSYVFVVLAGVIAFALFARGRLYDAFVFAIAFVVTAGTVVALKHVCAVSRPYDALITLTDYAFPSGHATFSAFFATSIGWLYLQNHSLSKCKIVCMYILLSIPAVIVGLSRLSIKVHTPFQVVVGFSIGVIVPLCVIFIARKYSHYCNICKN